MYKYKISATIIRPGGLPVQWVHYTEKVMTLAECEKMLTRKMRIKNVTIISKAQIENFKCSELS